MAGFVKGAVVTVPFPFSDLSNSKPRPALILQVLQNNELILCKITKKNWNDSYSVPIDQTDFQSGGLPMSSEIRTNHLWTADANIVLKANGSLQINKFNEVIKKIVDTLTS